MGEHKLCAERILDQEELQTISRITNPSKKNKNIYYTPILWEEVSIRFVEETFNSLIIIMDSRTNSSIVLGIHTQKIKKKITKLVPWSTQ